MYFPYVSKQQQYDKAEARIEIHHVPLLMRTNNVRVMMWQYVDNSRVTYRYIFPYSLGQYFPTFYESRSPFIIFK